jgi:serine-type D-Ala-D-Ala carboxypeptidase (penicillin-binding protein 5/6)
MTQTISHPTYGPTTQHAMRRRRLRRLAFVLALVVTASLTAAWYVLGDDAHRAYLSTDGWPKQGEGAYQLGTAWPAASPDQQPAPIASLAKVMTAYLVLRHHPLAAGQNGPTLFVTAHDVRDTAARAAQDQSVVPLEVGERLTERDALMALLLPSANNIAVMLARVAGEGVPPFVGEMNATAQEFGMHHTTYTDPSGFDEGTVSTATDQLKLARIVARNPTLSAMMATRSYRLPNDDVVYNTDSLLGHDGFVGMKTGSDDAAGGCFMFRTRRIVNGRTVELIGVVMGQRGRHLLTAGLYSAKQLTDRIAPVAAPA